MPVCQGKYKIAAYQDFFYSILFFLEIIYAFFAISKVHISACFPLPESSPTFLFIQIYNNSKCNYTSGIIFKC